MQKIIFIIFITFSFIYFSLAVAQEMPIPKAPSVSAKSYFLLDHNSGNVIAEKNADQASDPASITKLMTAYIVYGALERGEINLSDEVLISEKAWRAIGSRMFVEVNTRVTVDDLLHGLIVQSGNDASIALAEHIAGDEATFTDLMNNAAVKLGLTNSHFNNVTGLTDEQHYMTARDIALLGSAIISEFPEHYKRYSQKQYTYNGITQHNRNKLLWRDPSVDGLKTGHTEAAQYCLASSAKREDMRLIAVVLGAPSEEARTTNSQALLNYGFRFYESHKLYTAGQELIKKRVWYGEQEELSLGVKEDVLITIPRGRYNDLSPFLEVTSRLEAPIKVNQVVGKVRIKLGEQDYTELDLVALNAVAEGGIWRKISDFVLGYFN